MPITIAGKQERHKKTLFYAASPIKVKARKHPITINSPKKLASRMQILKINMNFSFRDSSNTDGILPTRSSRTFGQYSARLPRIFP